MRKKKQAKKKCKVCNCLFEHTKVKNDVCYFCARTKIKPTITEDDGFRLIINILTRAK